MLVHKHWHHHMLTKLVRLHMCSSERLSCFESKLEFWFRNVVVSLVALYSIVNADSVQQKHSPPLVGMSGMNMHGRFRNFLYK